VGVTVSVTGQQVRQTDCWSQLCGLPYVTLGLLLVQQGNRKGRVTVSHYSNCAVSRLHCGGNCQCNRATGKADRLLVTIEIVRVTVCNSGLTVSATGQQEGQSDC